LAGRGRRHLPQIPRCGHPGHTRDAVEYDVISGLDHTGMVDRLDLILPTNAS